MKNDDFRNTLLNPEEWDLSRTIGGLSLMRLAVSKNPFDTSNFFIQVINQAIKYLKEYEERGSKDGLQARTDQIRKL